MRHRKTREVIAWAAAALGLLVATGASIALWATRETPRVLRASLLPPEGARFEPRFGAMVLSPDGTRVAFVASDGDGSRLWVRSLDVLAARPLAGTEAARFPFWSPDSRFIGFFSNGKLRRIDATGGPPQALCDAGNGRGGTWSGDGTILFTPTTAEVIYKVPASGGTPVPVTAFDEARAELSHRFPQFLPDGKHFIFLVRAPLGTPNAEEGLAIHAASLDSMEKTPIVAAGASARFAASGHLLFVRGGALVAQPFDPGTLELSGDAVPVAESMSRSIRFEAIFSVSNNGLLLFQAGAVSDESRLVWLDRDGQERGTTGDPADYRGPALSHDQKRIAVSKNDPQTQTADIWVVDVERDISTRLTFDPANDDLPQWSADDKTIYFTSFRSGKGDVYSRSSSGTGTDELVLGGEEWDQLMSLSPDGTTGWLVSKNPATGTGSDIYQVDLERREAEVFLQTPFREVQPTVSPDGRRLLYESNESGRMQVFVLSLDADGGKWQISPDGGRHGRWTRDGGEIVYLAADGKLMAVEVTLEPTFSVGTPEALFDPQARITSQGRRQYDATPDGDRFLVNQPVEQPFVEAPTLVQNWTSLLER